MRVEISCNICGKHIGTVNKEQISEEDVAEFKAMFLCECGAIPEIISE